LDELKRYAEAAKEYTEAVELDATHGPSYLNRGRCYLKLKEYELALADFNRRIQLQPSHPLGYFNRSRVWETWKQWSAAIEDTNKALSLTTDAKEITQWRARLSRLQSSAASAADAVSAKKRPHAAAAEGDESDDPPAKRLKASGADPKSSGMLTRLPFMCAELIVRAKLFPQRFPPLSRPAPLLPAHLPLLLPHHRPPRHRASPWLSGPSLK
jgi:tetratricopeptide (TPR) repeat protein